MSRPVSMLPFLLKAILAFLKIDCTMVKYLQSNKLVTWLISLKSPQRTKNCSTNQKTYLNPVLWLIISWVINEWWHWFEFCLFWFWLNLCSAAQFVVYGRLATLDDSLSLNPISNWCYHPLITQLNYFLKCKLGKETSLTCDTLLRVELSSSADGGHEHEPWTLFGDDTGKT